MGYDVLLLSLALDLAAMALLTYAIYFHRHHRRDLTLGFMGVNIGLFAVASFVSTKPLGIAFGIGLFALLSVIRLRSTQITQEEIGYYFVAIVVGLVSGLSPDEHWAATITLVVVLIGVMYVADHPRLLRGYERRMVRLRRVYTDDDEMRAAIEHKVGGTVVNMYVLEVDYVQKTTRVDVRFRPAPPGTRPPRTHHVGAHAAAADARAGTVAPPPPGADPGAGAIDIPSDGRHPAPASAPVATTPPEPHEAVAEHTLEDEPDVMPLDGAGEWEAP